MPLCPSCKTENPEIARFCLACGSELAPAPPPEEERKPVTSVFIDIVGSTSRAEQLDPEDVLHLLEPYYARLRGRLEQHGGTVEKYIGDAVVAVFGAPVAHEDDPERAVRAGLAILEAIDELNEEDPTRGLHVRVGIATGEAIVSLAARQGESRGVAWGDVLNTAARIQSAAPDNGVLVGEETYSASAHAIEYRPHEAIVAKGKSQPVAVWQAVGVRDEPQRERASVSPFVGRRTELERVLSLWESVRARARPALAMIVGAPGIGKSRLVEEVTTRASEDGEVLTGRCLSYGEGITYWPVVDIVKQEAGILRSDDDDAASAKLAGLLRRLPTSDGDQLRTVAAALANLLAIATTPEGTYTAAQISQSELHWGIRRFLELLAANRPLLLVFEDLHWAEPTLLDLLEFLLDGEAPYLLLGSGRPELREARASLVADGERRAALELAPLTDTESEALLSELLGEHGIVPGGPLETLLRNAGGNPLFLEETVQMLIDAGLLDADGRPIVEGLEALPVPKSLQALIGARLDGLPADDKRIAQHASIAGTVFWSGAVAHLLAVDTPPEPRLESLERRDVVRAREQSSIEDEREWAFKHIVIRDVAYSRLPKGRRAGLHVRFADWIAALPGQEELVEILAYHLEQACRLTLEIERAPQPPPIERAVEALAHAAEKAERREGIREADRFYARALELVPDDRSETALELRLRRGRTQMILGELRPARDQLIALAEDADALGRADLRSAALVTLANIDSKQGRPDDARPRLVEAAALADEIGDRRLRATAAYEFAKLYSWFDANPAAAIEELRIGITFADELDDRVLRIEGHMRLGTIYSNSGRLVEAEEQYESARSLAGSAGSYRDEARASCLLAYIRYRRGDLGEGERLALKALEWLERTGDTYLQMQTLRLLARYAMRRGDLDLAERRLQEALPIALESGGWLLIETYRYLAEVLVRQGRVDDARELNAFARRALPEDDAYACAAQLVAEGIAAAASDLRDPALEAFREALRLLEEQQLVIDLAEARVAFARALSKFGEAEQAQAQLAHARETFEQIGAPNLIAEIDREFGEMVREAGAAGPPHKLA